jgi:hypothetical protein
LLYHCYNFSFDKKWKCLTKGESTFASHTSPYTDQSLQKSFHLSDPRKIELKKISPLLKIKKTPTLNPTSLKKQTDNGLQGRWTRTPAANTGFAKVAVQCFV